MASLTRVTKEKIDTDHSVAGSLLETWVYSELLKTINLKQEDWNIFHYRDKDQVEVDFILENNDNRVIGVEVKSSKTVLNQDFKGLRKLASLAKNSWVSGLVLYNGDKCLSFGGNLWAIPFSFLD